MAEPNSNVRGFDRTESAKEASNSASLMGDAMVNQSFNDIFRLTRPSAQACFLPSDQDLLKQLAEVPNDKGQPLRCEAEKHEKRGPLDVTVNQKGEMTSVTNSRGDVFTKREDGKWVEKHEGYSDTVVENLTVDSKGNMSYDFNGNGEVVPENWATS